MDRACCRRCGRRARWPPGAVGAGPAARALVDQHLALGAVEAGRLQPLAGVGEVLVDARGALLDAARCSSSWSSAAVVVTDGAPSSALRSTVLLHQRMRVGGGDALGVQVLLHGR
jgi:hypothetical protein